MAMDDLFKALSMFQQGVGQLQMSRAIAGANEQVDAIKTSEMNEQQQRSALQQLSNQLVGRLAGMGAPATTIQAATQAVGPKQFATPDQAILEGTLTGNQSLVKMGTQADETTTANILKQYEKKAEIDAASQARLFDHQLNLAALKQTAVEKAKAQTQQKSEDTAFTTNISTGRGFLSDLKRSVTRSGTWESRWGNVQDAATLDGGPYAFAINFSKIVDPNSVARESEVNAAMKYLLSLGPTSSKKMALAQIKVLEGYLDRYENARALAKQKGLKEAKVGNTYYTVDSDPILKPQQQPEAAGAEAPKAKASAGGFNLLNYLE